MPTPRGVLDTGALLSFGSDAPVETPNPFAGIHAAVIRQDEKDEPQDGWHPEQRLTVEEAVRAYTEGVAAASPYLPGVTGNISPGSVADLLVLDRDIFAVDPREIRDAHPLATIAGGHPTYDPGGMFGML